MNDSTGASPGSDGRTPAEGHPSPRIRTLAGQDEVVGAGKEPVISRVDGPSSPLPTRDPRTNWHLPEWVQRRPAAEPAVDLADQEPPAGREWTVVVLDRDGDPQETVTGFSSLDTADGYARLSPDIRRWVSVPSRPAVPDRLPRT